METDQELISLFIQGRQEAFNKLLQRYLPIIHYYSGICYAPGLTREDLVQAGRIGLFRAIRYYKASSKIRFSYYGKLYIKNQVFSAVRAATRKKHLVWSQSYSLDYSKNPHGEQFEAYVGGTLPSPEDEYFQKYDIADWIRWIARNLTSLENEVFQKRLEGKTYQEIAHELGVVHKSVDNAIMRIKRKLVNRLNARWVVSSE